MPSKLSGILIAVNFIGLLVLFFLHFQQRDKVLYVDSSKLINNYKGMTDARDVYQKKAQTWKANIDTLVKEVQVEVQRFERESAKMTARERDLAKQLIQTKQKQASDYQKATSEKASQEDNEMTRKVIDVINAYVKEYGRKHNCKIIFAATEYGNIAYALDELDVTDEILEELNKRYSGVNNK